MKGKTIFIIILTALLTAFLFLNSDEVPFNFIVVNDILVSKLLVIGVCVLIGFIIGFVVGRPRKTVSSYDSEIERNQPISNKKELSDEDRDYIS
ncbi:MULTISPECIES: hypothetical protein [Pedobacter]|uniref:hypothetical protein n=1 Tax=Pedobacter TaxID=84567 RepID=UPI001E3C82AB|nr:MULTISPECIES: hypothetical protein [Pedobacter]